MPFGMPHAEVVARARAAGSPLWWTGRDGAVWVRLAGPLTAWGHAATLPHCGAQRPVPACGTGTLAKHLEAHGIGDHGLFRREVQAGLGLVHRSGVAPRPRSSQRSL